MARKMERRTRERHTHEDVPYTMTLPDGGRLFVLMPGRFAIRDLGGELAFTPDGVQFLDRVRALATATPTPSPGYIRALRAALQLTQAAFAARVGASKMTVARWEWGLTRPSVASARSIDRVRRAAARRGVRIAA